jgi:aminoglycoside/choline kinase family phosphotransferase
MAKISNTESLETLFLKHYGTEAEKIEKLPLSGSNREYFYMSAAENECIGTIGCEYKENQAFISFAKSFVSQNMPVPDILEVAEDGLSYLQTYIKGTPLFDYLQQHRLSDGTPDSKTLEYYKKVLEYLPKFQVKCRKIVDFAKCYPRKKFDSQSIMWDLNYFKYYFLKATHTFFDEQALENDFMNLTNYLHGSAPEFFMYRDFQSRNIIIGEKDTPYFIDFQGGRKGPLQYDIASLLYDAKAGLSPEIRTELLDFYIAELKKHLDVSEEKFRKIFPAFALVRIMQAMGSYGYRGILEKKPHFLASIPPALKNLRWLLDNQKLEVKLPQLEKCLYSLTENEDLLNFNNNTGKLTVSVKSFSYRRGIPYDPSGNGGGFVFDCRAIHNPGRYEQYQSLTGRDVEVVAFFLNEPQMAEFLDSAEKIVSMSVKKYIQRGYANLSVNFGCTGGQHRSVYAAESMAEFLRENFPQINVELKHLEQEK